MSVTLFLDALIAGGLLYLCRRLRKLPRLQAAMCAFGAFFIAAAFPVLLGSISDRAATNVGLTLLLLIDLITGVVFFGEVLFGSRHHPVMTPLTCIVFGFAVAATMVDLPLVKTHAGQMLPATAGALRTQIAHARTIHAASAAQVSAQYSHLLLLGLSVLAFVLFLRWNHRRTHQPSPKPLGRSLPGRGGGLLAQFGGGKKNSPMRRPTSARRSVGARAALPWGDD